MSAKIRLFIFHFFAILLFSLQSTLALAKNSNLLSELAISPGASKEFLAGLERASETFYIERDYKAAAEQFDDLLGISNRSSDRDLVFGLRNASLYTIGNHSKALELICKDYTGLPRSDNRHLFDIHAHARKIALNEGYETAMQSMRNYRNKCKRDDFSPVWAGIPLVKMEFLKANYHVLDEFYALPAKDKIVLQQVMKNFADDPYLDYARYFLHDFDAIKRSELLRIPRNTEASYSETDSHELDYFRHQITMAPENKRTILTNVVNKGKCSNAVECQLVAQWFPNSRTARNMLVNAIYESWYLARKDPETAYQDLNSYRNSIAQFAIQSTSNSLKDFANELSYMLDTSKQLSPNERRLYMPIYAHRRCTTNPVCLNYLRVFEGSQRSSEIALRQIGEFLYAGQLKEFMEFYDKLPPGKQTILSPENKPFLKEYQQHYVDIRQYLLRQDIEGLLQLAIKIRGRFQNPDKSKKKLARYPYLASILFSFISKEYPKTALGEKAHFLLCAVTARRYVGGDAEQLFTQFISLYPNSLLIDDAYAELGLLKINDGDLESAKFYFKKVRQEYPDHNAADNALYYLAEMEISRGQYTRAIYYYTEIASHYGRNRLGKTARNDLAIMEGSYQAVRDRLTLKGLTLSFYSSSNHVASVDTRSTGTTKAIKEYDELVSLDGTQVLSEGIFRSILARHQIGVAIPAEFKRIIETPDEEQETLQFKATVYIGQVSVFDVSFVDHNDKLFVREKPNYKSKQVGAIPHDGKCIRYMGDTSVQGKNSSPWFEVRYASPGGKQINGWVSGQYLRKSNSCMN